MKKELMLWDKSKLHSCKAGKLREIGIYPARQDFSNRPNVVKVLGWYNSNEHFHFGYFENEGKARQFVEDLHQQIRGNKYSDVNPILKKGA